MTMIVVSRRHATVCDAVLGLAGNDDDGAMTDDDTYDFQRWRRGLGIIWTSELLRADGRTLRTRFAAGLMRRVRNCEADALRLCNIASGRGRTLPGPRSRVGLPLPAAWEVLDVGEFLWWTEQVCEVMEQTCDDGVMAC